MVAQQRPTGTITFLFTDIEGSTRLWQAQPQAMEMALRQHDQILREGIAAHQGHVFKTMGDAFCAAFQTAQSALGAAVAIQRALDAERWPEGIDDIRVRMALHTGSADERDDDYFGPTLNHVARLLSAGHGGQVLLSTVTGDLAQDYLPADVSLRSLGAHRLKDLAGTEEIYQLVAADLPQNFPPLRTAEASRYHLPQPATTLIGRQREVEEIATMLREPGSRLVTLTGVGGTGKTRLALQVAAAVADDYEHGVHFVDLSPVAEPSGVLRAIISTLGLTERGQGDPVELLGLYFSQRNVLLVLDNFEQVLAAAPLVARLTAGSPRLQCLVTSRAPIQISGEYEFPVPPLGLPGLRDVNSPDELLDYEAIALFVDRAQAVRHDFRIDASNASDIVEICRRLDGLPLAIELAAARVRLFTPAALLDRLDHRLKALGGGLRDLPERQQTLRGAIDWSYDLLDAGERQLFWRLAVFSGGWSIEAAEDVCGPGLSLDVIEGLESLLNKSLVRRADKSADRPHFTMLETIGEYAGERLVEQGEAEAMRLRHAAYFADLAHEGGSKLRGHEQLYWLDRLEQEIDNLRAALGFCLNGADVVRGVVMVADLRDYWLYNNKHAEGEDLLRRAVIFLPQLPESVQADALLALGIVLAYRAKIQEAALILEQAIALADSLGDRRRSAWASMWVHFGLSQQQLEQTLASVEILLELDDAAGVVQGLHVAAELMHALGDLDAAEAASLELIPIAEQRGDYRRVIGQYAILATVAYERRDAEGIIHNVREGLLLAKQYARIDDIVAFLIKYVGVLASWHNHHETAARLIGAVNGWYDSHLMTAQPQYIDVEERMENEVRSGMDDELFTAAYERGRSLPLPEALALAEEEIAAVEAICAATERPAK